MALSVRMEGCPPTHSRSWLVTHTVVLVHEYSPSIHAYLAAVAPHNPGFQTVIFQGSPGYALYPPVQVSE